MGSVTFFDFPAADPEKMSEFYSKAFGWRFSSIPGMPRPFWSVQTKADSNEPGINGGMFQRTDKGQGVNLFVYVSSIDETLRKITTLGGKVVSSKTPIPPGAPLPAGATIHVSDPEGNIIHLLETSGPTKQGKIP
jgi:predicted enzyme related to lactoylglutathione lyase